MSSRSADWALDPIRGDGLCNYGNCEEVATVTFGGTCRCLPHALDEMVEKLTVANRKAVLERWVSGYPLDESIDKHMAVLDGVDYETAYGAMS